MLYVTTRNNRDAFTVQHVLTRDRGEDGGLYLPLRFPVLSEEDRERLAALSFNQRVAEMLNLFFSIRLTGWDIDFCIGRYPVRLEQLPYRILMTECWHNPLWKYARLEQNLRQLLQARADAQGNWVTIAIRMALLAAVFSNRKELGEGVVDIAVVSGDFTVPISAWYLRKMGFPVGNIICCCNENKQLWDLLCHGQMRTDELPISTIVQDADRILPANLERLISGCGGEDEARRYLEICSIGGVYSVSDELLKELRQGIYVSVVSSIRVESSIPNAYNSYNYLMTPTSALAYSGLMDYRSKTGITRTALVLCDDSPSCEQEVIAKLLNLPEDEIKK